MQGSLIACYGPSLSLETVRGHACLRGISLVLAFGDVSLVACAYARAEVVQRQGEGEAR